MTDPSESTTNGVTDESDGRVATPEVDLTASFTITRTLDAPRTLVWKAWTDPAEMAEWLMPQDVVTVAETIQVELREGGEYRYTMVNTETAEEFPTGGVYLEVVEPERLRFTWGHPGAPVEGSPVVTLTMTEQDGRTELTFHLVGYPGQPGDGFVYDGWTQALDHLEAHLD